jgi:hypothetical protein
MVPHIDIRPPWKELFERLPLRPNCLELGKEPGVFFGRPWSIDDRWSEVGKPSLAALAGTAIR